MEDKIKETAKEEVERVKALANEAARSGAYLYPFRGFFYFLAHRSLWSPLVSKIAPTLTLGLGVTTFMFFFTYLPQAAFLTLVEGPLAPLSTVLLVLSESSTISNTLARSWIVGESLVDTFDGTLLSKNLSTLVEEGRQLKPSSDPIGKLGKIIKSPFEGFSPKAFIRYCMYLPLNFIPVVGTAIFIILQGQRLGPYSHVRYFQLKAWNERQRDEWVEKRRGAYTSFGVAATLLELIPVAGIFFAFTNQVGAALWAADLEQNTVTQAPDPRSKAKKAK